MQVTTIEEPSRRLARFDADSEMHATLSPNLFLPRCLFLGSMRCRRCFFFIYSNLVVVLKLEIRNFPVLLPKENLTFVVFTTSFGSRGGTLRVTEFGNFLQSKELTATQRFRDIFEGLELLFFFFNYSHHYHPTTGTLHEFYSTFHSQL